MKRLISIILLLLSALVIFNLCFFICIDYDGDKRAWVYYLFFHIAYILSLLGYSFYTTRRKFAILNSGLYSISIAYLILTTITCFIFCISSSYSIELEIFVFLIELLFYLLCFHYCHLTNRKAEKGIIKELKNSSKHESWIAELKMLKSFSDDRERIMILNSIIDEIRSYPVLSNSYTEEADNEVQSLINTLKNNFNNAQVKELEYYKRKIAFALNRRSEILKCSYQKT